MGAALESLNSVSSGNLVLTAEQGKSSKHLNTILFVLDMCHIVSFWTLSLISCKIVVPEHLIYKPWF